MNDGFFIIFTQVPTLTPNGPSPTIKMHHTSVGIPMLLMVGFGSIGLSMVLQQQFDHQKNKKEQERTKDLLQLKPIDIKQLYFDLVKDDDDWDMVRVKR